MRGSILLLASLAALAGGCASLPEPVTARGQSPLPVFAAARGDDPKGKNENRDNEKDGDKKKDEKAKNGDENKENGDKKDQDEKDKEKKKDKSPPKTLFEWAIGPQVEEEDNDEPKPLATDRPDFTQASSTVGLGRAQLEAGYTYTRDRTGGATRVTQTYPEALVRIGVLADWFELRVGENYTHSRTTFAVPTDHAAGLDDLYLGVKLGLTEQKAFLPEMAVILQATVPTGAGPNATDRILPGGNILFGWDVIKDVLDAGAMLQVSVAADTDQHSYVEWAQSFTVGYRVVRELRAYAEWYALYPTGAIAPGLTAQHYFDTGLSYLLTPDFQVDVRVGWGLSRGADDFFAGAGFSVRY